MKKLFILLFNQLETGGSENIDSFTEQHMEQLIYQWQTSITN